MSRATSPLKQAEDAILLDSTGKSLDEVVLEVISYVKKSVWEIL